MRINLAATLTFVIAAALGPALSASAEIYEWVDAQGRHHYTQNLDDVPLEQRDASAAAAKSRPELQRARSDTPAKVGRDAGMTGCPLGRTCINGKPYDPKHERRKQQARAEEQREENARQRYRELASNVESLQRQVDELKEQGAHTNPGSRRRGVSPDRHSKYAARHASYVRAESDLERAKAALSAYEEVIRKSGLPPGVMR